MENYYFLCFTVTVRVTVTVTVHVFPVWLTESLVDNFRSFQSLNNFLTEE